MKEGGNYDKRHHWLSSYVAFHPIQELTSPIIPVNFPHGGWTLGRPFPCGQILFDCHRIMKWVFMQPSAQFKLEQSSSTDGISNQSTTEARRGRHCANEFRRAEEISKKEATKTEPTSCNSFHYRFFLPPSFSFSVFTFWKNCRNKGSQDSYRGSSESFAKLNSKTGGSYFQRGLFLAWCFQQHHFPGEKEIN